MSCTKKSVNLSLLTGFEGLPFLPGDADVLELLPRHGEEDARHLGASRALEVRQLVGRHRSTGRSTIQRTQESDPPHQNHSHTGLFESPLRLLDFSLNHLVESPVQVRRDMEKAVMTALC